MCFVSYWAGLYSDDMQRMINSGVDMMMKMVLKLLGKNSKDRQVKALMDVPDLGDEDGCDLKVSSQDET
jgi:hypothetical protein